MLNAKTLLTFGTLAAAAVGGFLASRHAPEATVLAGRAARAVGAPRYMGPISRFFSPAPSQTLTPQSPQTLTPHAPSTPKPLPQIDPAAHARDPGYGVQVATETVEEWSEDEDEEEDYYPAQEQQELVFSETLSTSLPTIPDAAAVETYDEESDFGDLSDSEEDYTMSMLATDSNQGGYLGTLTRDMGLGGPDKKSDDKRASKGGGA